MSAAFDVALVSLFDGMGPTEAHHRPGQAESGGFCASRVEGPVRLGRLLKQLEYNETEMPLPCDYPAARGI